MKTALLLIFAVLILAIVGAILAKKPKGKAAKGEFRAAQLVTANEQGMFWRLIAAFPAPEYIVLTQVSFGALLVAKNGASRNSFSQKRADFVLTNKGLKVLAIVELDDSSHKGREKQDGSRDAMLIEAGYTVFRYPRIPEVAQLRLDLSREHT